VETLPLLLLAHRHFWWTKGTMPRQKGNSIVEKAPPVKLKKKVLLVVALISLDSYIDWVQFNNNKSISFPAKLILYFNHDLQYEAVAQVFDVIFR
jgi:hypothetical protein